MEWHLRTRLGRGGATAEVYPRLAADGKTAEWWTFDGQKAHSPMGSNTSAFTSPFKAESQPQRPLLAREPEPLGRALCRIACKDILGCPGAYDHSQSYEDAFCGKTGGLFPVPLEKYRQAEQYL